MPGHLTNKAIKSLSDIDLLSSFSQTAIEHRTGTDAGDYRSANRLHKRLEAIYLELKNRSGSDYSRLSSLFHHVDPNVRLWAASFLFDEMLSESTDCLNILIKENERGVAFSAQHTLEGGLRRLEGNLKKRP